MNTERFTGRVAEYARHRTRYPRAVVEWLGAECGLRPEWVVADVGAGTGMLAELFLENGNAVTAVEPNAEMRAECAQMEQRFARLQVVKGTAERTGLPAGWVDLVVVGRAFHWFDPEAAEREFRRVLRPGGWVALLTSGRAREETEPAREFEALLATFGTDAAYVRARAERQGTFAAFLRRLSGGVEPRRVEFREQRILSLEQLQGFTQSLSCAPLAGSAGDAEMRAALERFFARWSEGGGLRTDVVCSVEAGQVSLGEGRS